MATYCLWSRIVIGKSGSRVLIASPIRISALGTLLAPAWHVLETTSRRVARSWREALPKLVGQGVALRDLQTTDAAPLVAILTRAEVERFLLPPPNTVPAFERFIQWSAHERSTGKHACFAVTLAASSAPIGIIQVRRNVTRPDTAEWGFALGSAFWGAGVFEHGAALALGFAFDTMGVRRVEARAIARNGRCHRALQKLGAVQEGYLRESFRLRGERLDQVLWTIGEDRVDSTRSRH